MAGAAVPVAADIAPPVRVRLLGDPSPARPGEPLSVQLEIVALHRGELTGFRVDGEGWTALAIDAPAALPLDKGSAATVALTVAGDPAHPLAFACEWNGLSVRRWFDLAEESIRRSREPGHLTAAGGMLPSPSLDAQSLATPSPEPLPNGVSPAPPGGAGKGWSIRVHGRFAYHRDDGVTVGADGATLRVYDDDTGADELLAEGVTDAHGWYDVTFFWDPCWGCDGQPDIYVEYRAANGEFSVRDATSENVRAWQSAIHGDFTGSDLDLGTQLPAAESDHPALAILTSATRAWRWLHDNEGYDLDHVDVFWPHGTTGSFYLAPDGIYISSGDQWGEGTFTHEYGHHWMEHRAQSPNVNYCNGVCDQPGDCGHCLWCPEIGATVVVEGWPDWFGDVVTNAYAATYGLAARFPYNFESLGSCAPLARDPLHTEAYFAALLRDIQDATQDNHPEYGEADALAHGPHGIFTVMDNSEPLDVLSFLNAYRGLYWSQREALWSTAFNCGYDIDTAPPGAPYGLVSSHDIGVPIPDATVTFQWMRADDDASGIAGYSWTVTASAALPPAAQNLGDVTTVTTTPLSPGTYWFNIRALDRDGRWSSTYATYGPFIVRAADPANLTFATLSGWSGVLVPRPDASATVFSVPAPAWLNGESTVTWWNVCDYNSGMQDITQYVRTQLAVDGAQSWSWLESPMVPAGGWDWGCNLGPIAVRGGRHTFEARLDAFEVIAETNENDNRWAHQWCWSPAALSPGAPLSRAAPPLRTGGWDAVVDGSTLYYNCDGLRLDATGWWNAVSVRALDDAADYDIRLHPVLAGPNNGFAAYTAVSQRGQGSLDAVIVNRNMLGTTSWDAGVVNWSGATCGYAIAHAVSGGVPFGVPSTVALAQDEMVALREFYLSPEEIGAVSVLVSVTPADATVRALLLDQAFTTGSLNDAIAGAATGASREARLDANLANGGWYGLVLYRDAPDGTAPVTVTLTPRRTPPDVMPAWLSGWYAPLVPRETILYPPAAPDVLIGNAPGTDLYLAVLNGGPSEAASFYYYARLDDDQCAARYLSALAPQDNNVLIFADGCAVRGGRHTMTLVIDPEEAVEELDETNNTYGEQWIWSPLDLAAGVPVTRPTPPPPTAGWADVTAAEPLYYNCDGLRLGGGHGWWEGIAVMPAVDGDVDLRLHEAASSAKSGFSGAHAVSYWGAGQSDFVLVNFNATPFAPYDAGAVLYSGRGGYQAEAVASLTLGASHPGVYGPWTLPAGSILQLREFWLDTGDWALRLDNLAGAVNWGVSVHPADVVYQGKSSHLPDAIAWLNGPGQDEWASFTVPAGGWYCVAIWKVGSADLPLSGTYRLRLERGLTGVPDPAGPPVATCLAGIWPNPFNPQTTIAFDLAHEQGVRLAVYDLHGTRVRTLVAATLPRGRHTAIWDGRDDRGQPVASGVYMARFETGERREMRKMALLK